jgi:hypothetical protein
MLIFSGNQPTFQMKGIKAGAHPLNGFKDGALKTQ